MSATALRTRRTRGSRRSRDSELDALLFFGRERDAEIVVANLLASRLTVLYGASGVGKSSLLARRRRAAAPASARRGDRLLGVDGRRPRRRSPRRRGGRGRRRRVPDPRPVRGVLPLPRRGGRGSPRSCRSCSPRRRVNVLISVREDALARLDAFKARIPNVLANYLRLAAPRPCGGRAAIVGPLERWRELAAAAGRSRIEAELVEAVLDEGAVGSAAARLGGRRRAGSRRRSSSS